MIIYENVVKKIGNFVDEFGADTIIFFGDGVPDTLADYCYIIDIKSTTSRIVAGDIIYIGDDDYKILQIGEVAEKNLVNLGHLTINFTGDISNLLSGNIVVDKKFNKNIVIGTKIKIIRK
ncbi:PTS glucitol/sorbitol transporter subunit IIA [Oceanivirga salmonicida]|uniref:PTS glucitol/sorbitol transporter subunit IIA n=1 Tax=Oceanivirga salmonicida TaxID=1769291 RepID=UPI000833DA9C|nr:PTS glucitol/sorbitol transporter subunit IIA [Oceanivirga salmonicida]